MIAFRRAVVAMAVMTAPFAHGQSDAPVPRWEVVSIKPCGPSGGSAPVSLSPGRITQSCVPMQALIRQSYLLFANGRMDLSDLSTKIEKLPAWSNSEFWTIEAKAESVPGQAAPG